MMKKVLIPLDYHPSSKKVAQKGIAFAKEIGAEVGLVHVLEDIQFYNMGYPGFFGADVYAIGQLSVKNKEESERVAKDFLLQVKRDLKMNCETSVCQGETANEILRFARDWEADLVVLGSYQHNVLEKVLGTVAARILEKTEIPVLMIPIDK